MRGVRRGKSAGKFLRRAGPHGTHDSGAVLHRCVGVEGCGECPQAVEGVGSMGEAGGEACGAARARANFCAARRHTGPSIPARLCTGARARKAAVRARRLWKALEAIGAHLTRSLDLRW